MVKKQIGALCDAWYPAEDSPEAAVLVWSAPADGAWAVYVEALPGEPRRYEGLGTREDAAAVAEREITARLAPVP